MFILYLYFLQFQVNFYFFIWQIWFSLIVYVSLYTHSKFLIYLSRRFVYQDKLSLDNHHSIDVDHSTARCLFCSAIIDKVIFHRLFKRRLCWTLILAWMFQQLQHHRTFNQTINSPDGLRLNNNQTRQLWLNNSTDLTDQRVAVRSQIRKYKTQPKPKFPWLFFGIKRFFSIFVEFFNVINMDWKCSFHSFSFEFYIISDISIISVFFYFSRELSFPLINSITISVTNYIISQQNIFLFDFFVHFFISFCVSIILCIFAFNIIIIFVCKWSHFIIFNK